ncbi:hypothetical protein NQ234_26070, partial [Escherichia coli]|nr:hypothetical protein [Escherichia coli]
HRVAALAPGPSLARPRLQLDRDLDCLDKALKERVRVRLEGWVTARLKTRRPALAMLADIARDAAASPGLRVVAGALEA